MLVAVILLIAVVLCDAVAGHRSLHLQRLADLGGSAGHAAGAVRHSFGLAVGVRDAGHIGLNPSSACCPSNGSAASKS